MPRKIINYLCADVRLTSLYSDKSAAMDTEQCSIHKQTNRQTDKETNRQSSVQSTNRQTDRRTDRRIIRKENGDMEKKTDEETEK